ncbi:hypothetical protein FRC00_010135 [Tulasnella sp. 408]|nr:hypothetical protein FRC00_010135 [Tulasnella sp. 408]
MRGANSTITSPTDLPSASFSPPTGALPINILFSMSLTLALLASFLAVLGQQWLVYYRKRSGGGAEYQRWEQLRRYLGAKRWRLELVLDNILPSVLQIALVIFCVAFILYLGTLSKHLCYAIAAPLCIVALLILAMAISAAWDRWCPFKSPLSHVVQPILQASISALGRTISLPISFTIMAFRLLVHVYKSGSVPFVVTVEEGDETMAMSFFEAAWHRAWSIGEWFKRNCQRSAEAVDQLELIALKRVLCTSEDSSALVYAAINGQAIFNQQLLRQIFDDDELREDNLAECPSRAALRNCLELVWMSLGPRFPIPVAGEAEAFVQSVSLFKPLSDPSRVYQLKLGPVEPVWFIASGLKEAKARDESLLAEAGDDTLISQGLQRLRGVMLSYQKHLELHQSNTLEVITDAIATLGSPWNGQQPDHEIYVTIFEQALPIACSAFPPVKLVEQIGGTLSSLFTLLRSLERQIRDSATPPSKRKHLALKVVDSVHTQIGWMKEIISQDPMSPDNGPMLESLKIILSIFPEPGARGIRSPDFTEAEADDLIPKYGQFYLTVLRAVSDIEAALPPACAISKEVVPEHTDSIERKDQSLDTSFERLG